MYKCYNFPLHLFLILEKLNINFWNSKTLISNHFVIYMGSKWFYLMNQILHNELLLSISVLIENTAIDTMLYNCSFNKVNTFYKQNRLLVCYSYYFFLLKIRLTFLVSNSTQKKNIISIDKIFKNANWIERETSEMYGLLFYNKTDTRKLLLDYSRIENPMLKDFPEEGLHDIFFNFFESQVVIDKNKIVEL